MNDNSLIAGELCNFKFFTITTMLQWSSLSNNFISFAYSLGEITGLKGTNIFKAWKKLEASRQLTLLSATHKNTHICVFASMSISISFFPINS